MSTLVRQNGVVVEKHLHTCSNSRQQRGKNGNCLIASKDE